VSSIDLTTLQSRQIQPALEDFKNSTAFQFACLQGAPGSKYSLTDKDLQALAHLPLPSYNL
jgi:hypothetical protein